MQNNPDDPKVKKAYEALIEETMAQYNALDTGINFTFLKPGMEDPYAASPALGFKDVVENKNLTVFPTVLVMAAILTLTLRQIHYLQKLVL